MPTSKAFLSSFLLHLVFLILFGILVKFSIERDKAKILEIDLTNLKFEETRPLEEEKISFEKSLFSNKVEKEIKEVKKIEPSQRAPLNFEREKREEKEISKSEPSERVEKLEKREEGLGETKRDALSSERGFASYSTSGYHAKEISGLSMSKAQGGKAEEGEKEALQRTHAQKETQFLSQKLSVISELMRKNLTYPYLARRMGWQGELILSFILTPSGELKEIKIEKSTGYEILDKQAKDTLLKIAKYFPRPEVEVRVRLPISFRLEGL